MLTNKFDLRKKKKKNEIYLFRHPIKEYVPILFSFSVVGAMIEVGDSIGKDKNLAHFLFYYLLFCFGFYFYISERDKEDKKNEIAQLNQEIRKLEYFINSNKQTIDFLEKEIEDLQNIPQHNK